VGTLDLDNQLEWAVEIDELAVFRLLYLREFRYKVDIIVHYG